MARASFGSKPINNGQLYTFAEVQESLNLEWPADEKHLYTLAMFDRFENGKLFMHYLAVNIPPEGTEKGDILLSYVRPSPPEGTGLHKYFVEIFTQPNKLPDTLRVESRTEFDLKAFVKEFHLKMIYRRMFEVLSQGSPPPEVASSSRTTSYPKGSTTPNPKGSSTPSSQAPVSAPASYQTPASAPVAYQTPASAPVSYQTPGSAPVSTPVIYQGPASAPVAYQAPASAPVAYQAPASTPMSYQGPVSSNSSMERASQMMIPSPSTLSSVPSMNATPIQVSSAPAALTSTVMPQTQNMGVYQPVGMYPPTTQDAKYCNCVLDVKAKGGAYNPYAVCAHSVGTSYRWCSEQVYDFENMDLPQLQAYASLQNLPTSGSREEILERIRNQKQQEGVPIPRTLPRSVQLGNDIY